jgi:ribosomal subunit interface protein
MDIRIKTTDYQMTAEISSYLDERLGAIEKHLGNEASSARCEVEIGRASGHSKRGDVWFAEINLMYPGSEHMRSTAQSESVNAAIDEAKDEMMQQLRKEKRLHTKVIRKSGAAIKKMMRFGRE